ncbi:hypothetical protein [Nocardia fluminea]|uniref:Uncharacterized protein n=2 Tax=Nocardia fluminea TaxID=134984 RepID=A0A2N3VHW7_9NOCA|nr:hypothetical protein ATK86_5662 [Nocardia fluminea]
MIAPASLPLDRGEFTENPHSFSASYDDARQAFWLRVRELAVPPGMIEAATARRLAGDWAGACAAANVDLEVDLRALARTHGRGLAARIRADLRYLAPDLLRWHLPRIAPDGLVRPGLTMVLARYDTGAVGGLDSAVDDELSCGGVDSVYLVVRTPPAWAAAGQRISLALWDRTSPVPSARLHPHPRPNSRYRLDLHRHLWDSRRVGELRIRSGAARFAVPKPTRGDEPGFGSPGPQGRGPDFGRPDSAHRTDRPGFGPAGSVPQGCDVDLWADEAAILLRAQGRRSGLVLVRCGARKRVVLDVRADHPPVARISHEHPCGGISALPVLPDAATWMLPDLALLRAGAVTADRLHPLVASALGCAGLPGETSGSAVDGHRIVECRGVRHRIGLVDGVLTALDHDPTEIRREELLVALTGTPMPCLQAIDRSLREPDSLVAVCDRLDHGDIDGALTIVEAELGTDAVLRDGPLRDALEAAVRQRITYGFFRAGLPAPGRGHTPPDRYDRKGRRARPRRPALR